MVGGFPESVSTSCRPAAGPFDGNLWQLPDPGGVAGAGAFRPERFLDGPERARLHSVFVVPHRGVPLVADGAKAQSSARTANTARARTASLPSAHSEQSAKASPPPTRSTSVCASSHAPGGTGRM